jgi:glycosyltransferase involved in cell wall biosynthesis
VPDDGRPASVTVVVPAHDAEATLGAALASVAVQTAPPDQVVVVDDGSTDATGEVARGAPIEVEVLRTGTPSGPSGARNAGTARAVGEWVAFLDADDVWHPGKLEAQLQAARERPGTVIVASDWVRGSPPTPPGRVGVRVMENRHMLSLNRFQTSTVLVRRDVLSAVGGFDATLDGAEDWDLWLRASALGLVVKLAWPYVGYADLVTSYSKDTWRVYDRMLEMLSRQERGWGGTGRQWRALLAWHHLRFAVAFLLSRDQQHLRKVAAAIRSGGLVPAVPGSLRYLAPFLAGRACRRVPALSGLRPEVPPAPSSLAAPRLAGEGISR